MQRLPLNSFIKSPPFLLGGALLFAAVAIIYGQVFHFDFTNFDDPPYVYDNPMVKDGLSFESFFWALSTNFYDFWHPLTWWSHILDCEFFGLQPGLPHLENAAFHLANSLLLFGILARMTGAWRRSLVVALLFAVHPMHVESVAWISERKDVLSTFFLFISIGAYVGFVNSAPDSPFRSRYYLASLLAFALGLMAKAMIVTLPFMLLLLDFWPLRRIGAPGSTPAPGVAGRALASGPWIVRTRARLAEFLMRVMFSARARKTAPGAGALPGAPAKLTSGSLLIEKLPFFGFAFASAVVTYLTMKSGGDLESAEKVPFALRMANIPVAYVSYIVKLAWPRNLTAFYPLPPAWPAWRVSACLLLLIAISIVAWRGRGTRPWLCFGWCFFLGTLVPVIGIVANGFHAIADRYAYVSSVGLFIAVVWTIGDWTQRESVQAASAGEIMAPPAVPAVAQASAPAGSRAFNRGPSQGATALATLAALIIIIIYAALSYRQTGVWRNSGTLWTDCIAKTKDNATAYCNLGFYYRTSGEMNLAIINFEKAFALRPDIFEINVDLGSALLASGRAREATNYYQRAVALMPDLPYVNVDCGLAEMRAGDDRSAVIQLQRAVELNPGQIRPLYLRGLAFDDLGEPTNAMACYQSALLLEPANAQLLYRLGLDWLKGREYPRAVASLSQAVINRPGWAGANERLAAAYLGEREPKQAREAYQQAIAANPFYLPALQGLAWLLATSPDPALRDGPQAVTLARRACEQTGNHEIACLTTLAAAYAEAGQMNSAITTAQAACATARAADQTGRLLRNQELLQRYQSGQPYRDTDYSGPDGQGW